MNLQIIADMIVEDVPENDREQLLDTITEAIIAAVDTFGLRCGGTIKLEEADDEQK